MQTIFRTEFEETDILRKYQVKYIYICKGFFFCYPPHTSATTSILFSWGYRKNINKELGEIEREKKRKQQVVWKNAEHGFIEKLPNLMMVIIKKKKKILGNQIYYGKKNHRTLRSFHINFYIQIIKVLFNINTEKCNRNHPFQTGLYSDINVNWLRTKKQKK